MDDFLNRWQEFVNDHSNRSFSIFYDHFYKDLLRLAESLIRNSGLRTSQPFDFVHDAFFKLLTRARTGQVSFGTEFEMWNYLKTTLERDFYKKIDRGPDLFMSRIDDRINDKLAEDEDTSPVNDGRSRFDTTFFEDIFGYVRVFQIHYRQRNAECYRLLNRLIIEEYSYDELITLDDFVGFTYDTLRQRKRRCILDLRAFLDRYC